MNRLRALSAEPSMTRRLIFSLTLVTTLFWLLDVVLGLVIMEEDFAEIFAGALQDTAEGLDPLAVGDLEHRGGDVSRQQLQTTNASGEREYLIYQVRYLSGQILIRSHYAPEHPFDAPLKLGFWKNATYLFYTAANEGRTFFVQVADAFENRDEAVQEGG